jgi:glycerol-3-phosphate dehydrogenase
VTHLTRIYGRDSLTVLRQRRRHRDALDRIHPGGPDVWAQVYHAVEREWATTVEDVIRRRTTLAVRGLGSPGLRADVGRVIASANRSCDRDSAQGPGLRLVRPLVRFP